MDNGEYNYEKLYENLLDQHNQLVDRHTKTLEILGQMRADYCRLQLMNIEVAQKIDELEATVRRLNVG